MKVGFVALIGRPNSGKSTLLNACIGESLAPVSPVPNTTRVGLRGIYTTEQTQVIFIDTPGFQMQDDLMGTKIRKETVTALKKADVILRIVDASRPAGEEDARIDELLAFMGGKVLLVYTKCDLPIVQSPKEESICVKKWAIPVEVLVSRIAKLLPEWERLYDPEYYTDIPPSVRIGEIIREQAILRVKQEIPHALYVHVEDIEHTERQIRILAYVVVERESQKIIVIGKAGAMIQAIGYESRMRIEEMYEKPVFLQLRVRVEPNWTKNPRTIERLFQQHA